MTLSNHLPNPPLALGLIDSSRQQFCTYGMHALIIGVYIFCQKTSRTMRSKPPQANRFKPGCGCTMDVHVMIGYQTVNRRV